MDSAMTGNFKIRIEDAPELFTKQQLWDALLEAQAKLEQGFAPRKLEDVTKELFFATLHHFDNNKMKTAEALGVTPKTIYNWIDRWGIGAQLEPNGLPMGKVPRGTPQDEGQWNCCGEKSDCYQCDKGAFRVR